MFYTTPDWLELEIESEAARHQALVVEVEERLHAAGISYETFRRLSQIDPHWQDDFFPRNWDGSILPPVRTINVGLTGKYLSSLSCFAGSYYIR